MPHEVVVRSVKGAVWDSGPDTPEGWYEWAAEWQKNHPGPNKSSAFALAQEHGAVDPNNENRAAQMKGAAVDAAWEVFDDLVIDKVTGNVIGKVSDVFKGARGVDDAVDAAPGAVKKQASGTSASGRATDSKGRKLGPSGKPMIHVQEYSTEKQAKDAARQAGKQAPAKDSPHRKGGPHFHPVDEKGKRIEKEKGNHYEFP